MESFTTIITIHAIAALFVLILGPFQILRKRRDLAHRIIGASWVLGILTVCITSFWIHDGSFSWLHGLAIWTILCMVFAITGIRMKNVPIHRGFMIGSYLGTLIAFVFAALIPARLIPRLVTSEPVVAIGTTLAVAVITVIWVAAVIRFVRSKRRRSKRRIAA